MDLLFLHGHWHGLAKLRMHHDITLDIFDTETRSLGVELRSFCRNTCAAFDTVELRREQQARIRREARNESSRGRQNAPANASGPSLTLHSLETSSERANSNSSSQDIQQPQNAGVPVAHLNGLPVSTIDERPMSSALECSSVPAASSQLPPRGRNGRRRKRLNINTYKFHSYGDYLNTIREYGTTDSYSTELVRLTYFAEHLFACI